MRDYAKVLPSFWIGQSGKKLRGNMEAQLLALYLMTSPHANMIGVYHCPILYMAHETGMSQEGASKALASLIEAGFCHYEEASETVFVVRMAAYQIDEALKPNDKRVIGVIKDWQNIDSDDIRSRFYAIYSEAFHLPNQQEKASPIEDPCKPHRSQEQEQEQEQDIDAPSALQPKSPRGTSLRSDWQLPDDWKSWAEKERPDLDAAQVADSFRDFWIAKPGKDGRKADWLATWRNWVRNQRSPPMHAPKPERAMGSFV